MDRFSAEERELSQPGGNPEVASEQAELQVQDDELLTRLALSRVKGIGPKIFQSLLQAFHSASKTISLSASEIAAANGVSKKIADKILSEIDLKEAEQILEQCGKKSIQVLTSESTQYPALLKQIYDPPSILYQFGNILPEDQRSIAIVGSRKATRYGIQVAETLGRDLARMGITVVSGLARGIDSAAHKAALDSGGRTIAVLGSGLMNLYPPENRELAIAIGRNGAVVSENDLHQPPHSTTFPRRNRIISGMSLGVVVVEAARKSGAQITARMALEQNREVFAVPGRIDSPTSIGCNDLLKDGAVLVQCVEDILEELGSYQRPKDRQDQDQRKKPTRPQRETAPKKSSPPVPLPPLSGDEKQVFDAIKLEPTGVDQIVHQTGLPIHRVLTILTVLQTKKRIRRLSGQLIERAC